MPKFTVLDPKSVLLGRQRSAAEARKPYVEALVSSEAGRIDLSKEEVPSTVKRRLSEAAAETGVKVRSSWDGRSLFWRKSGKAVKTAKAKKVAAPKA